MLEIELKAAHARGTTAALGAAILILRQHCSNPMTVLTGWTAPDPGLGTGGLRLRYSTDQWAAS